MRAGGCTVQQALTSEAAAVVKQALALARRRGHAQVTPLHVASTMLSSSGGLLRSACLQSHSHPFQCKALELCFNVALNRLPASSSSPPILGGSHHHHQHPSLSNALVAAFKRAQAHQRRGSVESQQQPLLAVKIELEQLVVSILDDPSVSRVMREAGFSSTQVKANVLQAVSVETVAPATNPSPSPSRPMEASKAIRPNSSSLTRGEDATSAVLDCMVSGTRRGVAVVGESLASAEGVVEGVMDRVERGEVSAEVLRNLQFITLPLFSFRNMGREEVDQKVGELRCLVESCRAGIGGVVLYLGDLSWAAEFRSKERGYYFPVEHAIMEIRGLLVCGGSVRFWVMGMATHQTYMSCRVGNPSLESLLGLQALTIPAAAGLELSLNLNHHSSPLKRKRSGDGPHWPLSEDGIENQLTCCGDCSIKFESEARGLRNASSSTHGSMITWTLPSWLLQYREESNRATNKDQESLQHLCKKWNSICDSTHGNRHPSSEITLHLSSISPSSSSVSSYDCQPSPRLGHRSIFFLQEKPNPNSTSSSETMEMECPSRFREINTENLKILCNALERKVTWQKTIIPEIASTILQCRSGMMRRKDRAELARAKEETWLYFQGGDADGKEKIARELATLVFGGGTRTNLVCIELSTYSSTRSDSVDDQPNKRSRSESSQTYLERLFEALRENPHRVFLVEDIEQVDSRSQMGIKAAIESGRIRGSSGEEVDVSDAIIILSCESFDSASRACSPPVRQRLGSEEVKDAGSDDKEFSSSVCLDLNLCAVDDEEDEDCYNGDVGLVDSVDRAFFFKLPNDL
ncbi:protein SMAX1-LIKE 3 [Iris pallida]|uniref:Protein SMAX1-LIKE 3 n=1 Tax=Iris pallida TaxID=29817 RepID=A0AAX6FH32_IRIPA|nr:protein SMAX1-LIKE 3 [Iris pallida]